MLNALRHGHIQTVMRAISDVAGLQWAVSNGGRDKQGGQRSAEQAQRSGSRLLRTYFRAACEKTLMCLPDTSFCLSTIPAHGNRSTGDHAKLSALSLLFR